MSWLKALLGVLLLLLLGLLISRLEIQQVVEHRPTPAPVAGNPFLAASRLLDGYHIDSRHFPVGQRLHLPNLQTLLVLDQTRARLDPQTSDALHDWLSAGGHLVMAVRAQEHDSAAEWRQRLPLLSELGLSIEMTEQGWDPEVEDPFLAQLEHAGELFMRLCVGATTELREMCETALCKGPELPPDTILTGLTTQHPWRAQLDSTWHLSLEDPALAEESAASLRLTGGNPQGDQLLMLDVGGGRLTLLTSVGLWHNERLHWLDHAALLQYLASDHRAVWFASAISVPPLHIWLWQRSWPLIISLLVILALFIGYQLPRRGPLLQPADNQPQDFSRHLLAAGQLLERRGDYSALLAPLRRQVLGKLAQHGISARRAPRWCAKHTHLSRAAISSALQDQPTDRQHLVTLVDTLQQLRNLL